MIYKEFLPHSLAIGVPYETFWGLNPRTLEPFFDAYRIRMEREAEQRSSDIDISAWQIGRYVREAVVSALNSKASYPEMPLSLQKKKAAQLTSKDEAEQFRVFLKHYKRPPVAKQGGETHGD